jgi:hypothetical protein
MAPARGTRFAVISASEERERIPAHLLFLGELFSIAIGCHITSIFPLFATDNE